MCRLKWDAAGMKVEESATNKLQNLMRKLLGTGLFQMMNCVKIRAVSV